ncbi:Uncharacterized protein PECH_004359 [Penicillium ucsense]|uniref:Uncharacterized protein n=1 Tax=Penicillium ucsense TaxID=2839758 RepID=A0A8J8WKE5_9EURO|nr:Uncharacterized protein PECM_005313 [Penicillium ucsense]KAF7737051.1 Uncharacterized protein PECH_004359 [Penicillium ucsense]
MADIKPVAAASPEPKLENLTWIEVTRYAEEVLARFENDETTFKRWEVKVVWEYWRGFEMMGINPSITVLKFMQDLVIPFASSRVRSRLQCHTRYEKATGADKSKTYKIETPVDEGPEILYRKGFTPEATTPLNEPTVEHEPESIPSSTPAETRPSNQPIQWDLGAHMRATAAAQSAAQLPRPEPVEPSKALESTNSSTSVVTVERIKSDSSTSIPFDNVPVAQTIKNILNAPISKSKLVASGPSVSGRFPAPAATHVDGRPEMIRIVCNGEEEIVGAEDLVSNNYLLRSTIDSLNTTMTSMQAIIKSQQGQIDNLSGYIESQHARIRDLNEQIGILS